jgi:hypothetical protein
MQECGCKLAVFESPEGHICSKYPKPLPLKQEEGEERSKMKFNDYFIRQGACTTINTHSASSEYIWLQNELRLLHKGQINTVRIQDACEYNIQISLDILC